MQLAHKEANFNRIGTAITNGWRHMTHHPYIFIEKGKPTPVVKAVSDVEKITCEMRSTHGAFEVKSTHKGAFVRLAATSTTRFAAHVAMKWAVIK